MIDFGTDDHDYDEVQDLPEESNNQLQQPTSQSHSSNICDNSVTASTTIAGVGGTTEDSPPELPPPKQKSVKNSKNKQKQKSANKSKIPRSPSLASSFSNLASSISGINNSNVPPQTPPLPTSYQQTNKNKTKLMNGAENNGGVGATSVTGLVAPDPSNILDCNRSSNSDSNLMESGVLTTDGSCGTNLVMTQDYPCASGSRSQIQLNPIAQVQKPPTPNPASPKNFQYLTLTVRKDDNGYGMKVSIQHKSDFIGYVKIILLFRCPATIPFLWKA